MCIHVDKCPFFNQCQKRVYGNYYWDVHGLLSGKMLSKLIGVCVSNRTKCQPYVQAKHIFVCRLVK